MTRHTGEVDVYHLGKFRDLGTRHNVLHWADSAKQVRISTAIYRRFYYFLTADERIGRSDARAGRTRTRRSLMLDPIRKIRTEPFTPKPDVPWVLVSAPRTGARWPRRGSPSGNGTATRSRRTKLINGATTIAAMPNGWAQGGTLKYNLADGKYAPETEKTVYVGSLDSVFGLLEIMPEIIDLLDDASGHDSVGELLQALQRNQCRAGSPHWYRLGQPEPPPGLLPRNCLCGVQA